MFPAVEDVSIHTYFLGHLESLPRAWPAIEALRLCVERSAFLDSSKALHTKCLPCLHKCRDPILGILCVKCLAFGHLFLGHNFSSLVLHQVALRQATCSLHLGS